VKKEAQFFGHTLPNPIVISSGAYKIDISESSLMIKSVGALTIKSLKKTAIAGNPPPRGTGVCKEDILECYYPKDDLEDSKGIVNYIGLEGPGIDGFISQYALAYQKSGGRFIASAAGNSVAEYVYVVERLSALGIFLAIEVNVSCPNVADGLVFGTDANMTYALISELRKRTKMPLIVKLAPNVDDICKIAEVALLAGADGLSLINTILVKARMKDGREIVGGLSGPIIRPIAKRLVKQVCNAFPNVPVIAGGGVWCLQDVLDMLSYGATLVGVGTLNFTRGDAVLNLINEYEQYVASGPG